MSAAWTRRLSLYRLLIDRGLVTTRAVHEHLRCTRRTALDDLKTLQAHGVPLEICGEGRGRAWRLAPDAQEAGRAAALALSAPGDALVAAVLWFSEDGAAQARTQPWPPGHSVTPRGEGLELRVSAPVELLLSRILAFGAEVEVRAPRWLRREVIHRLKVTLGRYEDA